MIDRALLLIIADSTQRTELAGYLRQSHLVRLVATAATGAEGLGQLHEQDFDAVICERQLPDMDGLPLVDAVRRGEPARPRPVILLAPKDDVDDRIRCLENGASDILTLPCNPEELAAILRARLRQLDAQEQLLEHGRLIAKQAGMDAHTGLINAAAMQQQIRRELERCQRKSDPCSLVILELGEGSRTLDDQARILAELIEQQLRTYDILARITPQRFSLLLPETPMNRAMQVSERLRLAATDKGLNLSLGLASYPLGTIRIAADLLREAEHALDLAIAGGGNQVRPMITSATLPL